MKRTMNKSIIGLFLLGITLILGCVSEDNLDVTEYNTISEDNLEPEQLVIAAYSALDYRYNTGEFRDLYPFDHAPSNWPTSDIRSGDAYKGGGGTGDNPGGGMHQLETHNLFPSSDNVYNLWRSIYFGLKRVDTGIRFLINLEDGEFENRDVRLGELYTLRAHFYFEAMKNFGSIVWYDENTPVTDLTNIPNTFDEAFIWGKIEGDLTMAIDLLPETQADLGRVNEMVARSFLAKAHLFQEEWQEVITQTNIVINSGQYRLVEDIERLYSEPGYGNPENIFAIQFSINDGSQYGNLNFGDLLNSPDSPSDNPNHPYLNGDDFHKPSQNLANAYKVGENGLPLFNSYNSSNVDSEDLLDPRLDHTIGRPGITWKDWEPMAQQENWSRDSGTYGLYVRKKNMIYPTSDGMASNPNGFPWALGNLDFPLIKYSDLLLWKAEALIETGDVATGVAIINQIRLRAKNSPYVKDFENPSEDAANYLIETYPTGMSQEMAIEALRFERRLELANEGHRFFDLVRWGIADSYINQYVSSEQARRPYLTGANLEPHEYYLPIPQVEIDASGGTYTQRSGD
ncbi:RagB/SusD family nutrient uptake outer membrane protein [Salegentibacter mishustinae]|uniref:RagB/SusD family nutrient uptake outer membrane protein n=1 Tax=Salegentibacter mishustinae TaxID=270918 RepID=UPI002492D46F|nr:RagB/SusD family nutrient uptake outer membrane protein [Salegentibacter mishustinae]